MDALLAPLLNTDGSCEITSGSGGKTRILCGVTGPGDVSGSRRMFDRAALFISINRLPQKSEELTIIVKPSVSQLAFAPCTAHSSNRFINSTVESAIELEAYPRTGIQICTQELKVDGPTESAQLNGICLALLDSGIQMHYIFAAVTMALMETVEAIGEKAGKSEAKDEYIIEPNQLQAKASRAVFTFVFRPSTILAGKLIGAYSSGKFTLEQHQKAAELAERNCLGVFDFYRRKMQEKFIHEIGRDY